AVERVAGLFQRNLLDHRPDAAEHGKGECLLYVAGRTRRMPVDGLAARDQLQGADLDRVRGSAEDDELAAVRQPADGRGHRVGVRDGGEHDLVAAVDVMPRTELGG